MRLIIALAATVVWAGSAPAADLETKFIEANANPCSSGLTFVRLDNGLYVVGSDETGYVPLHVLMPGVEGLTIHGELTERGVTTTTLSGLLINEGSCV